MTKKKGATKYVYLSKAIYSTYITQKKKKWFPTFSFRRGKMATTGIMKSEDGPQNFLSVRHNEQ